MQTQITLVPAYGRDYRSAAKVKADWQGGKDFRIADMSSMYDGAYVNAPQQGELIADGFTSVMIRYNKLQDFTIVELSE